MSTHQPHKLKKLTTTTTATSLALTALLALTAAASAALTITTDTQNPGGSFTPSWSVPTDSLIAGMLPTSSSGDFTVGGDGGGLAALTDGAIGPLGVDDTIYAFAGQAQGGVTMVYTLPDSANGYGITNITVFSGWNDYGRAGQCYNISYSTKANPASFISLGTVDFRPNIPGPFACRVIMADSTGAPIAPNVAAIQFDFSTPLAPFNYNAYAEITVEGTPAATVTACPIVITTADLPTDSGSTPAFTIETDSLIAKQSPSSVGGGSFLAGGCSGTPVLTDGSFGVVDNPATYAACGSGGGLSVTYALTNSVNGSDLTNLVVYSGWGDWGRDGQFYNVLYSTKAAPTTFIPLTSVWHNNPGMLTTPNAVRVAITTSTGAPLAKNVDAVKFDFSPQSDNFIDNGWSAYAEIVVEGTNSAPLTVPPSPYLLTDTQPLSAATVVGEQVFFSATFSASPPASLQWQVITNGLTNNIPNATNSTLALTDVQLTNSGYYQLMAVNATNAAAAPAFSTGRPLTVSAVPDPVNGIIAEFANELGTPTWSVESRSLIADETPDSYVGDPTLTGGNAGGDITNLTDGMMGFGTDYASCGGDGQSVSSLTYSSAQGWNLTNIVVYTAWTDYGREGQFYNISYSTLSDPTTFLPLVSVTYNPNVGSGVTTANRVRLIPVSGQTLLASNVAAVTFDFTPQGSQDYGWSGYTEIVFQGSLVASTPLLLQSPHVSGGNLIITGTGGVPNSGYTLLTSTNLLMLLADWTVLATGVTDAAGAMSNAIPVNAGTRARYFRLQMP